MKRLWFPFAYNLGAAEYLENFWIAAVTAIVGIRAFLELTGYPQLGGGGLHIAHMLWGGLLMLGAMTLMLVFLNKEARQLGAIVGGLGFGVFIDELGKFVTQDNNYFYQPTISLLYVIFVLLFLGFRWLSRRVKPDEQDYTINALELLKEAVFLNLDMREKLRALAYLEKAGSKNQLARSLAELLMKVKAKPGQRLSVMRRVKRWRRWKYVAVFRRRRFAKVLMGLFVVTSIVNIFNAVAKVEPRVVTFWSAGEVVSTIIAGGLTGWGVYLLRRRKRLPAYEKFKQSVVVYILLGHFFAFYREQLRAVDSLIWAVLIYLTVRYLIEQERLVGVRVGG